MADAKSTVRSLFSILLLVATGLGLYNVFSENAHIVHMAEREACGGAPCTANQTRMARNPFWTSFTFQVEIKEQGKGAPHTVDVECKRAYYLFGKYECKRLNY